MFGKGRPIFWFHSALGAVELYQPVAERTGRPFYGIQASARAVLDHLPLLIYRFVSYVPHVLPQCLFGLNRLLSVWNGFSPLIKPIKRLLRQIWSMNIRQSQHWPGIRLQKQDVRKAFFELFAQSAVRDAGKGRFCFRDLRT
jgi:hypothetical protein